MRATPTGNAASADDRSTDAATRAIQHAARADEQVAQVSAACGVRVQALEEPSLHHAAAAVLQRIWGRPEGAPLPSELLRAFAHNGNYVGGVFDGRQLVGMASGFRTDHGALHSHIAGVLPSHQGRSIGYLLKLHQRAWALRRGITSITWTFDPLLRRNAHFNLVKLGATPAEYLADFYGEMTDQINAGDRSDRLLVEWDLHRSVPGHPVIPGPGATTVLAVGDLGEPQLREPSGGDRVIAVAPDIETVRRADPELASRWRAALRTAVVAALRDGHRIVGMNAASDYLTRRSGLRGDAANDIAPTGEEQHR